MDLFRSNRPVGTGETKADSMRNAQLVHALVDRRVRFMERLFDVFQMIVAAVVVCDAAMIVVAGSLADVLEATVDEREHVLGGRLIEHPPIIVR